MKNSTIIGISVLAVAGASFYFYSKGKKSTTTNSTVSTSTTPTDDTKLLQDLGVTITPTTPTPYVKPVEGVPLLTSENIQKALLSLNIDQTRGINELASPNYIEAKRIAGNMKEIDKISKKHYLNTPPYLVDLEVLNALLSGFPMSFVRGRTRMLGFNYNNNGKIETTLDAWSFEKCLSIMTQKINSLGYKVLPNFEIEKM